MQYLRPGLTQEAITVALVVSFVIAEEAMVSCLVVDCLDGVVVEVESVIITDKLNIDVSEVVIVVVVYVGVVTGLVFVSFVGAPAEVVAGLVAGGDVGDIIGDVVGVVVRVVVDVVIRV